MCFVKECYRENEEMGHRMGENSFKNTVMNALRGLPVKESSSLEKKIKTSKASGLKKEDKDLKGPC